MSSLAKLQPMQTALVLAKTPKECASLAEKAKAVAVWAKHIGLSLSEQNRIARFRIDCMRKAGEMLRVVGVRRGSRTNKLLELGVAAIDSSRWQQLARVPESLIIRFADECGNVAEFTHAGLLRFIKGEVKESKASKRSAATAEPDIVDSELAAFAGRDFACIYADPPWRYGNQGTRAATKNHYDTMTVDEICALPIRGIAANDAHLHLWTTNAFLFDAKRVMEAWGFEYKSCFVWVKPQMGLGNYYRVSHEFLLLGARGDCPFDGANQMSWGQFPRGKHSSKPDKVRQMIERVSPGPRVELFARDAIEGWSSWGNQTKRNLFTARKR